MKKLIRNWKEIFTVCLIFGLVGCGGWVNEAQIENANILCKDNGGIKQFSVFHEHQLTCNNGAVFEYDIYSKAN